MIRARRLLPLTCALALAFPASALAGGAGDDQYQDPFGDEPAQTQSSPAPQESAPAQGAAPQADSGSAAPAPAPSVSPAAPALPRTGADAGLIAAGGGVLLVAGLALRRRTADGVPR